MYKGRPSTFSIFDRPPRVKQKSLSVPFLNKEINIFFRHKLARFDFLEFDVMVKKKKLKYKPIWDAVRSAYPDWMHNKVDDLAGKFFGQVKFDTVQYQEKLAELQEKSAKRKRKSLLFWKEPAAKKAKTKKN